MIRILIENGPHAGQLDVSSAPDHLDLLFGTITMRYHRVQTVGDDFIRAVEARYRWDGVSPEMSVNPRPTPGEIQEAVEDRHDGGLTSSATIDEFLEVLALHGYRIVHVDDLSQPDG